MLDLDRCRCQIDVPYNHNKQEMTCCSTRIRISCYQAAEVLAEEGEHVVGHEVEVDRQVDEFPDRYPEWFQTVLIHNLVVFNTSTTCSFLTWTYHTKQSLD
jgi:hypothetical protein